MKTKNIVFALCAVALLAFNGCSKDNTPGGGGYVPAPTPVPSPKAPQVKCYDATPTSLSNKHAAMLCSSSAGPATVTSCYDNTPLAITNGQASLTCSGSPDVKPVDCINSPSISALDNFNASVLCSNSGDNNSIACFNNSSLALFDNEAAVMCQRAKSLNGPNECFNNTPVALPEPDAATLCSQTVGNGTISLDCYSQTPLSLSDADAAILCQKSTNATATLSCWQNSPSYLSDHEAAILCSGAVSGTAANDCVDNTSTSLSNYEAAFMCSGATSRAPISCYNGTDTSLSEFDAAVLCSSNNGLLTSMYAVNTQYNNRISGRGGVRGQSVEGLLAVYGNVNESGANLGKMRPANLYAADRHRVVGHRQATRNAPTRKSQNVAVTGAAAIARVASIRGATIALSDKRKNHADQIATQAGGRKGDAATHNFGGAQRDKHYTTRSGEVK